MSNKTNLYWYRHNEGNGNFGDELNPYIVEKLSGKKAKFVHIGYFGLKPILFLKTLTYALLKTGLPIAEYIENIYYYFIQKPKVLVAIGSVLQTVKSTNCIIWGSGIIETQSSFAEADFRAVRGKRTQERLKDLGYKVPETIGDPAILLPLLYQPKMEKKYKMGIIPHFIHFKDFTSYQSDEILVVNLLDPIEKVIDEINSCELTFSTSLHGIIVSHAYGVPSVWCKDKGKKLAGDDIKFSDYFSSVNINIYTPIGGNQISKNINENLNLLNNIDPTTLIVHKNRILEIQQNLLKVFPYPLTTEFQKYL